MTISWDGKGGVILLLVFNNSGLLGLWKKYFKSGGFYIF